MEVAHTSEKQGAGFHALTRAQLIGTLAGLILTLLLSSLDQTIVGTAMPRIIAQLNGFERYAWVTTTYLLTSTIMVPIIGKLSDMYGRKYFLLAGAIIFVAALGTLRCRRRSAAADRRDEPADPLPRPPGDRRRDDRRDRLHRHRRHLPAGPSAAR